MSSACRSFALLFVLLAAPAAARELRVCADPNNLPFSNARGEGFENRIMAILARDLDATVATTWWAQRRGFLRNTIRAGLCDIVPGIPSNMEMLRTTEPYYRSTYVWVSRAADSLAPRSLDDPVLRRLTIGVQIVGDDGSNTPPAHALSRRGHIGNIRGYSLYADYGQPNPPARIVEAVAAGEVDIAAVWGPLAGYFATRQAVPLNLAPVRPQIDGPRLPMVFDISMGVRREDEALAQELDAALARNRTTIDVVLEEYGVPRLDRARLATGAAR
jgi:mxaJ protein